MTKVGIVLNSNVENYKIEVPFNPPTQYIELQKFNFKIDPNNNIYKMVRDLLIYLKMDEKRLNTSKWNPFSDIIKPDDKVFIKPNFVNHSHPLGENGVISQITHASILRPVIDYILLALNDNGKIIIADTPIDKANFKILTKLNGTIDLIKFYNNHLNVNIELYDLRSYFIECSGNKNNKENFIKLQGPPGGYKKIDLKYNSELKDLDGKHTDYYTLADTSINKFDIRSKIKGKTNEFHNSNIHIYKIPKLILESNVVISIPKLKTHKMAGVSLNLKNAMGICEKIYLPHHRRGSPPLGDAYPKAPSYLNIIRRKLNHKIFLLISRINIIEKVCSNPFIKKVIYTDSKKIMDKINIKDDWWGAWYGNDTLWRTIFDLNKILLYSDCNGNLRDTQQRKYFNIIDGIIGQEGEGPMDGIPKSCGIIIGGFDPVASDLIAAYIMGYNIKKLKIIKKAEFVKKYKFGNSNLKNINIISNLENPLNTNLKFKFPKGYKDLSR